MSYSLAVKHNIEVAHRLSLLPGKCEAIHGHSMQVTLQLYSQHGLDENYLMEGLDFADIKKKFRGYLDEEFDHRLLLNAEDIWAQPIYRMKSIDTVITAEEMVEMNATKLTVTFGQQEWLPGLKVMDGDPSTENIARTINRWAQETFGVEMSYKTTVWETAVNMAEYQA